MCEYETFFAKQDQQTKKNKIMLFKLYIAQFSILSNI